MIISKTNKEARGMLQEEVGKYVRSQNVDYGIIYNNLYRELGKKRGKDYIKLAKVAGKKTIDYIEIDGALPDLLFLAEQQFGCNFFDKVEIKSESTQQKESKGNGEQKMLEKKEKTQRVMPTREEVERIIKNARPLCNLAFSLVVNEGLKVGELLNVEIIHGHYKMICNNSKIACEGKLSPETKTILEMRNFGSKPFARYNENISMFTKFLHREFKRLKSRGIVDNVYSSRILYEYRNRVNEVTENYNEKENLKKTIENQSEKTNVVPVEPIAIKEAKTKSEQISRRNKIIVRLSDDEYKQLLDFVNYHTPRTDISEVVRSGIENIICEKGCLS